jgi:hypothetical protein
LKAVFGAILFLFAADSASAQSPCITDGKNARLVADFQTASLICPKWEIVSRVDYAFLLMQMNIIKADDLLKSDNAGAVKLREQCQADLYAIEKESFKSAEEMGTDKFCLRTSVWLTVPNVRDSLERNGFFPSNQK